jgi:hypothetical protein
MEGVAGASRGGRSRNERGKLGMADRGAEMDGREVDDCLVV